MGVKLSSIDGADEYRQKLYELGDLLVHRLMRPWLYSDFLCKITGYHSALQKLLFPIHSFTTNIINSRRKQFQLSSATTQSEENMYVNLSRFSNVFALSVILF